MLISRQQQPTALLAAAIAAVFFTTSLRASDGFDEAAETELHGRFASQVRPFLNSHCLECHGGERPEGELDLSRFATAADVVREFATWDLVLERMEAEEMPPEDAPRQPSSRERTEAIEWIRALRRFEAERNAGDPGEVLARRLSAAEYNYSIFDLTGVDIQPAREFPVDPANEAGFDNTGESLTMTPALLTKYLSAARVVADHLVLKPDSIDFAPHPVATDTDRDKYCVRRIVDFYQRQNTNLADYFLAAWRFQQRAAWGEDDVALPEWAARHEVSGKYLETVLGLLIGTQHDAGPIKRLRSLWQALPHAAAADESAVRSECEAMRDYVAEQRDALACEFPHLRVRRMHNGSQPLVLWRNRQYATHRRTLNRDVLLVGAEEQARNNETSNHDQGGDSNSDAASPADNGTSAGSDAKAGGRVNSDEIARTLTLPADAAERDRYIAALEEFCSVFPDKFYVAERGREFLDRDDKTVQQEKGRLLSAGFHSMMGYFRDDAPLYELLLDEGRQQELDALWRELDFIALAPVRQHAGFVWFERTDSRFMITEEFDFARAEDKDVTSEAKIVRLAEVYLAKAESQGADEVAAGAIRDHFDNINASVRWVEQSRLAAEPAHVDALQEIASRAYGRPLSAEEQADIAAFYRVLRDRDGLDHEEAVRDTFVSVLMSPHFCYRTHASGRGPTVTPLPDYALASRLSYFLWSSLPDDELLTLAGAGQLHDPDVLLGQAQRMLRDERVHRLATEFGGHWLDFRQFDKHNSVDRDRFPTFDDRLRQAMFEEPIQFIADVVRGNGSVLDFLYADHTFVNDVLAKHYQVDDAATPSEAWRRLDQAGRYGRGGLLPMAAFLTQNSPGLRTSPVKRGYWVVRRLLGEHIPPPPPTVPELPADESTLGELTLREVLEKHREHESCAACHQRFDALGLAFENYGPVGELRTVDLGGRAVETQVEFPGGWVGDGLAGLREYLREQRQEEFVDNLCQKLLSYGLSRSLIPSDDPTLRDMRRRLHEDDYRFHGLVESIVTSPQFLNQRGADSPGTTR